MVMRFCLCMRHCPRQHSQKAGRMGWQRSTAGSLLVPAACRCVGTHWHFCNLLILRYEHDNGRAISPLLAPVTPNSTHKKAEGWADNAPQTAHCWPHAACRDVGNLHAASMLRHASVKMLVNGG